MGHIKQSLWFRALHTELELEYSSQDSSGNEFSRVETRRVERHFFVIFGNLGKRLVLTLIFAIFAIFLRKLGSERVRMSWNESGRVRKARNIFEIFWNSKNGDFRNSRKRKFRKKSSNSWPYCGSLFCFGTINKP